MVTLAACAVGDHRPEVSKVFITPDLFRVLVLGPEEAAPPQLRRVFLDETASFAFRSGCESYRVIREEFSSSDNFNIATSTSPASIFGKRPHYIGFVQCELSTPLATSRPGG